MYSSLIRDPKKVIDSLSDLQEMVVAKKPLTISIPEYYVGKKLASFGSDIYIVASFAYCVDGYYAVSNCPATIRTEPSSYKIVKVDSVNYYELSYEPGDVVIVDKNMIKDASIASGLYSLFIDQGKTPWFMNGIDLNGDDKLALMINCNEYSGMKIGDGIAPISMIISVTAKSPEDDSVPYRKYINETNKTPKAPNYIGIKSIEFIASSTISRMTGNYYNDSVGSALLNKTNTIEGLEMTYRE